MSELVLTGEISAKGGAEQYITCLYGLIENCEYDMLKEEMRDRLVVGIRDPGMSLKLQMDAHLTLEKAKKANRQKEAIHEQQQELQGAGIADDPIVVEEVRRGRTSQGQRLRAALSTSCNPREEPAYTKAVNNVCVAEKPDTPLETNVQL